MKTCLGDYDVETYTATAVKEQIAELTAMREDLLDGKVEVVPPWSTVQDSIANVDACLSSWRFLLKTAHNGICTRYIPNN